MLNTEVMFTIDDLTIVPKVGAVNSRSEITIYPGLFYSSPMDTVTGNDMATALLALGEHPVISRYLEPHDRKEALLNYCTNPQAFIAIGVNLDNFLSELKEYSIDLSDIRCGLCVDVAHGTTPQAINTYLRIKSLLPDTPIMSGSICTPEQAWLCFREGVTHLRVGIGNGSVCTTRLMTGVGVPNAYAVHSINESLNESWKRVDIIADGGIRYPGDVVKYLALGADSIMLGRVLSKASEAPGWIRQGSKLFKSYRGMASSAIQNSYLNKNPSCPEGVSLPTMEWKGDSAESILNTFKDGLRSSISYMSLKTSEQVNPNNVTLQFITPSAALEGQPHGLTTNYSI